MKISIIIPTYNSEHTIIKCVESALNQTYKSIDVIIIDDGSSDGTEVLLKKTYSSKIRYYRTENKGVSSARNYGLKMSNGDAVFFMDADDYIDSNVIERLVKFAIDYNLDMVCCGRADENSTIIGINHNMNDVAFVGNDIRVEDLFWAMHPGSCVGKLIIRNLIEQNNFYFVDNISLGEDFLFIVSILSATNKIGVVNDAKYRAININANSLSKKYVNNIEDVITLQLNAWESIKNKYNEIDIAYATEDMDFKLHKVKMYSNNVFKKESIFNFYEGLQKIAIYIENHDYLYKNNVKLNVLKSKERKIESIILLSKNATIIASMYYIKEKVKSSILRLKWRK